METLKKAVLDTGLSVSDLVYTAFSAASTYRDSDKRGGANGGRLALAPQKDWAVNRRTVPVIEALRSVQSDFAAASDGRQVSLADLIVLAGTAAVEQAARAAGSDAEVRSLRAASTRRRSSPTSRCSSGSARSRTGSATSCRALRPVRPGCRARGGVPGQGEPVHAHRARVGRPDGRPARPRRQLGRIRPGVFTDRVGVLTTDFFVNLTDTDLVWTKDDDTASTFTGRVQATGEARWRASRNDLVFGSNAQLRSIADAYAGADGQERFVRDFVEVWSKVMMLDRYDVKGTSATARWPPDPRRRARRPLSHRRGATSRVRGTSTASPAPAAPARARTTPPSPSSSPARTCGCTRRARRHPIPRPRPPPALWPPRSARVQHPAVPRVGAAAPRIGNPHLGRDGLPHRAQRRVDAQLLRRARRVKGQQLRHRVAVRRGRRADAAKATASTTSTPSSRRVAANPSVQLDASHTTGSAPRARPRAPRRGRAPTSSRAPSRSPSTTRACRSTARRCRRAPPPRPPRARAGA